jgi:hypothetical protein
MPPDQSGMASPMSVTRTEIIDHVAAAFASGPATTSDLLVAAKASGARSDVVDLLAQVPDRRYQKPHDLWVDLPGLPIGG